MPTAGFFVKDIVIIGDRQGLNGEHRESMKTIHWYKHVVLDRNNPDRTRVDRIVKQILSIATYTRAHASPEQLTRAITDEFSFYTQNTPLSVDEYRSIINKIAKELKSFPPNIVIIASSMPVLWPDDHVRNAVLHIQTPNHAEDDVKIHHFSKQYSAADDPFYVDAEGKPYPRRDEDQQHAEYSPHEVLAGTALCINDVNQHHSAILVEGEDLPPIIHAIDICFDHAHGVAMSNAVALLQSRPFPPLYISHMISSQSIEAAHKYATATVSHADFAHTNEQVSTKEKEEPIYTVFGRQSTACVYQPKRAEILHSGLFDIATVNRSKQDIAQLKDPHQNTLLHLVLLETRKPSSTCVHFQKRLKKLMPFFRGSAINQQNADGDTPLHLAIESIGNHEVLIRFLEQGARLDISNLAGLTPLDIASHHPEPNVLMSLITKLINNGAVYLAHRDTILTIVDALQESLQHKLLMAAVQFELSDHEPNMPIMIALLKKLAPLSVLNLSITSFATRQDETQLDELLSTDRRFVSLNPDEKEIIKAYLTRAPQRLLPFKAMLYDESPLIEKLTTLFTTENAQFFTSWMSQSLGEYTKQAGFVSLLKAERIEPEMLLKIASQITDFNAPSGLPNSISLTTYFLSHLYRLHQEGRAIPLRLILNKIGSALYTPSPQHHVKNMLRLGMVSPDGRMEFWVYTTLLQHELLSARPQLMHILSLPQALINWNEPGDSVTQVPLSTLVTAYIFSCSSPLSLSRSLLNHLLPKDPAALFDMLSNIIALIDDGDSGSDTETALIIPNRSQLYQHVLLHECQEGREANVPLMIEILKKGVNLKILTENKLTLAEQLLAHVYVLRRVNNLPQKEITTLLDFVIPQLQTPLKNSIKKIMAFFLTSDHTREDLHHSSIKQDLYQFLLEHVLNHPTPERIGFEIIIISIHKIVDLTAKCLLLNQLTIAEQAIATLYKIERHHPINATDKGLILHELFAKLETPIERSISRIISSFSMPPNQQLHIPIRDIVSWIYRALLTEELHHYSTSSQREDLKFLRIAMQQPFQQNTGLNAAESVIVYAARIENEHLFLQAYDELRPLSPSINIPKLLVGLSHPEVVKRSAWISMMQFRVRVQNDVLHELQKFERASLQRLTEAITFLNLKEPCGLNNGLTMAEQFIAQAVLFTLYPSSVERLPGEAHIAEQLLEHAAHSLTRPLQHSIRKIVNAFLTPPLVKFEMQSSVISQYIYRSVITKALTHQPLQVNTLLDILSQESPDYCLHDMPGIDPDISMAEQIIKAAILSKNEQLLEGVIRHCQRTGSALDNKKILASCPSGANRNHWLGSALNNIESKWRVLNELKKGAGANTQLIMRLIHDIDANASCELNNGLNIFEQAVAQSYLSPSPELLTEILDGASWNAIENIIIKVDHSLVAFHLDVSQNEHMQKQFKTFCYTTLLSLELCRTTQNPRFMKELLSQPYLSFQQTKPDGSLLLLSEILYTTAAIKNIAVLTLFYREILPQTPHTHLIDAIRKLMPPKHQTWIIDHLMHLANQATPVDASTVTLLSTLSPPPNLSSQQFFRSHQPGESDKGLSPQKKR